MNIWIYRLYALLVVFAIAGFSYLALPSVYPYKLGLDLSGGTHLVFEADVSGLPKQDIPDAMSALRDTIERRVNLFGVAEPLVQTEKGSALSGGGERLIVELPGVEDTQKAIEMIGKTPVLEFRLKKKNTIETASSTTDDLYQKAAITGAHLKKAQLGFTGGSGVTEPVVEIWFNNEGKEIFAEMTKEHVGEVFGIFLDGKLISDPVIREPILGGRATISGNFTTQEARKLARDLNFGALPVPIHLLTSQTVGASLGADTLKKGVEAAIVGLVLVSIFLIGWYRLSGLVATVSLLLYITLMLLVFKFLPVTLTAAGLAGFILSIGMAVDANILIFERLKEELNEGKLTHEAVRGGFKRAWLSIRDGNLSSLITAVILFWFGTSMVEGFALVFGIGVLLSMFTAITVSRSLLLALGDYKSGSKIRKLYGLNIKE